MRRSRVTAIVLGSLCIAFAARGGLACTSFSSDSESAEGGPATDGASIEDRAEAEPVDAGPDVIVATRGCAVIDATFCDDFDDGKPLSDRWGKNIEGDASIDRSDARARSAPASLRVASASAATPYGALLAARVPTFTDQFFMAFDVLFVVAPSGGNFLLESHLTPTAGDSARNDAVGPTLAIFPADNPKDGIELRAWNWLSNEPRGFLLANIPLLVWTHIETSIRPSATGTSTLRFVVDGVPQERIVPSEARAETDTPSIFLGGRSGGSVLEMYYDNVIIDAR